MPTYMDMPEQKSQNTISQNKLMGILAYLGILVLIPFFVSKDDQFVKFHVKQGLVLFILWIIVWFLHSMLWELYAVWNLINIAVFIFVIFGIVHVVKGKQKELPFVGQFAKYFTF
jgi:uncharacterized membrane protein